MDNQPFSQTVKLHLEKGEIGEAISVFKTALEGDKNAAQPLRMLRVIESNFQLARQNEQKGILSFAEARQEYARATDAVLALLETVANGKSGPVSSEKKMQRGLLVGVGLAGLVFLAVLFLYPKFKVGCPEFDETKEVKVMILPFVSIQGNTDAKPHVEIRDQINKLAENNKLSFTAAIQTSFDAESELPDKSKARRMAEHCGADLIIWGKYVEAKDSIRVSMDFVSLKTGRAGTGDFHSLADLSFWDGHMEKGLGDAVFAVCARVAGLLGNQEVTTRWLGKVKEPDGTEKAALEKLRATN